MISSQLSAQQTASCSGPANTGTKRIVISKGALQSTSTRQDLSGCEAPPPEQKSNWKRIQLLIARLDGLVLDIGRLSLIFQQ